MAETRQHPPIDPELVETIWPTIVESFPPLTLDAIPGMREMTANDPSLSGGDLTLGGRIDAESRTIKFTPDGPELPAIILRPAGRTEKLPCLYYTANGGKIIQSAAMALGDRVGWRAILGDSVGGPDVSPYAAAARASELEGLPPTYMEVGGSEVFRDEDIDYATRLGHAGVPTELHVWVGGFHGFELWAPDSEIGSATLEARTSYLRRALRDRKNDSG